MLKSRNIYLWILLICTCAVGYSLYAQYQLGFHPCPLCIAQRVIIILIGMVALISYWINPKSVGCRIIGVIITIIAGFAIKVALHHMWLMDLPKYQQPQSCGMPLSVLYDKLSTISFLKTILNGDAECALVHWKIFGFISPPAGVIIIASIIIYLSLYLIFRRYRD